MKKALIILIIALSSCARQPISIYSYEEIVYQDSSKQVTEFYYHQDSSKVHKQKLKIQ